MAQQQQNVTIAAPGFMGLNTQLSPVLVPPEFASIADNCVIDSGGRVANRKGHQLLTEDSTDITGESVKQIKQFLGTDGVVVTFCVAKLKIWKHTKSGDTPSSELVEMVLPYTATGDDWQIIPFNDKCYFIQAGHDPVYYNHTTGSTTLIAVPTPSSPPSGLADLSVVNCGLAAFGRLWFGDFSDNKALVGWSPLLDGTDWELASGAGTIDLSEAWPRGFDSVVALAAHNDFLIIFGQESILVYHVPSGGASVSDVGPAYMTLADTVNGIGCVARDSVQTIGTDLFFLDSTGLRSFQRTIQEASLPIGDVSENIKNDITLAISQESRPIATEVRSFYYQEESMYFLFFPTSSLIYVFDTERLSETGAARVTLWPASTMKCAGRGPDNTTCFGGLGGLYQYTGNVDKLWDGVSDGVTVDTSISWKYWTHALSFGESSLDKFPKQVDATVLGTTSSIVTLKWAYDYDTSNHASDKVVNAAPLFYFGTAEFGADGVETGGLENGPCEFSGGSALSYMRWNTWGHGKTVKYGFEASLDTTPISLQEINIQALLGRR